MARFRPCLPRRRRQKTKGTLISPALIHSTLASAPLRLSLDSSGAPRLTTRTVPSVHDMLIIEKRALTVGITQLVERRPAKAQIEWSPPLGVSILNARVFPMQATLFLALSAPASFLAVARAEGGSHVESRGDGGGIAILGSRSVFRLRAAGGGGGRQVGIDPHGCMAVVRCSCGAPRTGTSGVSC